MIKIFLLTCLFFVGNAWAESIKELKVRAAEGDSVAQYNLGTSYAKSGNSEEAEMWFRRSAQQGNTDAEIRLASSYAENDREEAKWWTRAALKGNKQAQFNIGAMYEDGRGVFKDQRYATEWFLKAAEQGSPHAMYNLGNKYKWGNGVLQDSQEAIRWWRLAAEKGHRGAQYWLGLFYYNDEHGVIQDYVKAHMWLNIAASRGDRHAPSSLKAITKEMSSEDIGKAQDMAREWIAKEGLRDKRSFHSRGEWLAWFKKKEAAAERGHRDSQIWLGNFYSNDENAAQDYVKAHMWVTIAAYRGDTDAPASLKAIAKEMSSEDIRKAQRMARKWIAQEDQREKNEFHSERENLTFLKKKEAAAKTIRSGTGLSADGPMSQPIWNCADNQTSSEQFADRQIVIGADQGDENKQLKLAQALQIGKGCIKQDQLAAIHWYKKAANQGNLDAQLALAVHYVMPSSADKAEESNHAEAFKWSSMAAQQGSKIGQADLAFLYVMNQGIQYDPIKSLMWATIAGTEFNQRLGNLEKALTTEVLDTSQVTEARNLAKQCVKKQFKDC